MSEEQVVVADETAAESEGLSEEVPAELREMEKEAAGETETPDEVEGAAKSTEAKPKETKVVPYAALHEEREKRKELSAKLEEADRRTTATLAAQEAKFAERFNMLVESLKKPPEPEEIPDYDEDPVAYMKWKQDQQGKDLEAVKHYNAQQAQASQVQEQLNRFFGSYRASAQDFSQNTPDFTNAYNYLIQHRDKELQELGFVDPVIRQQILQNEEIGIVEQAFRNGANPAERLYKVAVYRGYANAPSNTNTDQVTDKEPTTLNKEKATQAATVSLGAVPGTATAQLTAESLLNLPDEDFSKLVAGKNLAEILRGA